MLKPSRVFSQLFAIATHVSQEPFICIEGQQCMKSEIVVQMYFRSIDVCLIQREDIQQVVQ